MFENKIPFSAIDIIRTLKNNGAKAYLVGGCIRDLLLGITPNEWDITTDALPSDVSKLFLKVIPTGIKYGTVTVIVEQTAFEVTTFRKDEKYFDGRHPENVFFTKNLKEDLARRDFTINAMAYDPVDDEFIDLFLGQKDLENKTIKAIGNPIERFSEDGLRPVRACRFASKLNFKIEKNTFTAIPKILEIVKKVAIERVKDELVKLLVTNKPSIGIEYMRESKLLALFIPELENLVGVLQPKEYHRYDVYWHSLFSCDAAPKDNIVVRLAALFHDIAKPICQKGDTFYDHDQEGAKIVENILTRLRFGNEMINRVCNLVENHMFNYEQNWTDSAVRRFIRRVGIQNLENVFSLRIADTMAMGRNVNDEYLKELKNRINKILEEENALNVSDLKISGFDVMRELNLSPGPKIGSILNVILEKVLDDPTLNDKEKLLKIVRSYAD